MARTLLLTATLALASVATPAVAGAQAATPRRPARAEAPAASAPVPSLRGPREVALGGLLELHGGAARGEAVRVERRLGDRWRTVGRGRASAAGRFRVRFRAPGRSGRLTLRARAGDGAPSRLLRVGVRPLVLAAVGDVNLGDLPGAYIARFGPGYPWGSVGPVLRRADLAFANLECAVSRYGRRVHKRFTFRGRPFAARGARRAGGLDVVNLANNHSGDFGPGALRDTLHWTHRFGIAAVGAGRDAAGCGSPSSASRTSSRTRWATSSSAPCPRPPRAPGSSSSASLAAAWSGPASGRRGSSRPGPSCASSGAHLAQHRHEARVLRARRRSSVASTMVDAQKVQWAGYAVAAVLVVVLGATYLRSGGGGTAGGAGPGASRTAPVKVTQGGGADAVVDVTGAVRRPGVYRLPSDRRVQDAVRRAGGPTRRAELAAVNLAARLTDGAQILVPVRAVAGGGGVAAASGTAVTPAGPVNLNTATPEQLDGLDGIGPTTAQKIVEYRKEHGGFGSLQDLDRIPGIGPKRLAALKGKVTP